MTANSNKMPAWLMVLLGVVGLVVLGPPVLALLLGAIGLALGLAGAVLKIGVVVLVIWAIFMVLKGIFGTSRPQGRPTRLDTTGTIERLDPLDVETELEQEHRRSRAELDRELELAIHKKANGAV